MPEQAIQAWTEAARILGFTFVSPYQLARAASEVKFDGFLPQFGGPKGMVISVTSDFKNTRATEKSAASQ